MRLIQASSCVLHLSWTLKSRGFKKFNTFGSFSLFASADSKFKDLARCWLDVILFKVEKFHSPEFMRRWQIGRSGLQPRVEPPSRLQAAPTETKHSILDEYRFAQLRLSAKMRFPGRLHWKGKTQPLPTGMQPWTLCFQSTMGYSSESHALDTLPWNPNFPKAAVCQGKTHHDHSSSTVT
jgi:hypothetical protein